MALGVASQPDELNLLCWLPGYSKGHYLMSFITFPTFANNSRPKCMYEKNTNILEMPAKFNAAPCAKNPFMIFHKPQRHFSHIKVSFINRNYSS